ncbi:MAG TPA: hypothetical protein VFX60_17735 [Micromonospora sp.]|nr:hypothetical protein [Micromonospora sp.]
MIAPSARTPLLFFSYALRGALAGLAVCGALYFAWRTAAAVHIVTINVLPTRL